MLNFKSPTLEDLCWVRPIFQNSETIGSDNTFGNIFFWKNSTKIKILNYKNFILRCYEDKVPKYRFPFGKGNFKETIDLLKDDAEKRKINLIFGGITENEKDILQELMPDQFEYLEEENREDYIYKSDDLINLSGKKYHSKRNHISKFKKNYNWKYSDITKENISECKGFIDKWFEKNLSNKKPDIIEEKIAIHEALDNFNFFDLLGGIILVDSKIVALTIAEKINEKIVDVHFEKAFTDYDGIYAVINNEFSKRRLNSFKYINREEDLGIEGLRKSKKSYHPHIILKRYEARLK